MFITRIDSIPMHSILMRVKCLTDAKQKHIKEIALVSIYKRLFYVLTIRSQTLSYHFTWNTFCIDSRCRSFSNAILSDTLDKIKSFISRWTPVNFFRRNLQSHAFLNIYHFIMFLIFWIIKKNLYFTFTIYTFFLLL